MEFLYFEPATGIWLELRSVRKKDEKKKKLRDSSPTNLT